MSPNTCALTKDCGTTGRKTHSGNIAPYVTVVKQRPSALCWDSHCPPEAPVTGWRGQEGPAGWLSWASENI